MFFPAGIVILIAKTEIDLFAFAFLLLVYSGRNVGMKLVGIEVCSGYTKIAVI